MARRTSNRAWEPVFDREGQLHLTLAIGQYDHVRDLTTGQVRPEGIALTALHFAIEEIIYRFVVNLEWEVSEVSFAKYVSMVSEDECPLVALPVFPSRMFRRGSFYVRDGAGIESPRDLAGKRIGIPEWSQTAGVFARGLLSREWNVPLKSITWLQAGVNEPGRVEKASLRLPEGIEYRSMPHQSLNALLLDGEIDAILSARPPLAFTKGDLRVRRLIPESLGSDVNYFRSTGIYPIMHVLAVRREVLERFPWVAVNLCTAFEAAKRRSLARMSDATCSYAPVPQLAEHMHLMMQAFGPDPFPYGLEANRATLEAFLAFANEQAVTRRLLAPEELFPIETLSCFKV